MKLELSPSLIAFGVLGVAALLLLSNRQGAQAVGGAAVDMVDGVLSGAVFAVGDRVGVPVTNADRARQLMDEFDALPWYEQAAAAFSISAYASAGDYLRWVVNHAHRPAPGAY